MAGLWDTIVTMFGLDHLVTLIEWIKSLFA